MKNKASVWELFRLQKVLWPVLVILWLGVPLQVEAQRGVLSFHGQVVHAGCQIDQPGQVGRPDQVVHLQVGPGLAVDVNAAYNACAGRGLPFTAQFRALDGLAGASRPAGVAQSAGVLTVTYQ